VEEDSTQRGSLGWLMRELAKLPPRALDEELGAGAKVGRYRLVERIGRGGFGVVYRAVDTELARDVALKLLRRSRRSPEAEARLLKEAQAMAKLKHANVVTVHDVGTLDEGHVLRRQPRALSTGSRASPGRAGAGSGRARSHRPRRAGKRSGPDIRDRALAESVALRICAKRPRPGYAEMARCRSLCAKSVADLRHGTFGASRR
jgi:hypothetical protein